VANPATPGARYATTVDGGLTFEEAGEHELKGVPDRWRLHRVVQS
jgi:hypothetical protein